MSFLLRFQKFREWSTFWEVFWETYPSKEISSINWRFGFVLWENTNLTQSQFLKVRKQLLSLQQCSRCIWFQLPQIRLTTQGLLSHVNFRDHTIWKHCKLWISFTMWAIPKQPMRSHDNRLCNSWSGKHVFHYFSCLLRDTFLGMFIRSCLW